MTENEITGAVVDACIDIHKRLGPGLLESCYESVLAYELSKRGISVERQVPIPLIWDGMLVKEAFRADLVVGGKVIVEIKSTEINAPVFKKQLLTYLRVSGLHVGLLVNFGQVLMRTGIERVIDGTIDQASPDAPAT